MSPSNFFVNCVIVTIGFCVFLGGKTVTCLTDVTCSGGVPCAAYPCLSSCNQDSCIRNCRVRDDYFCTPGIGVHKLHTVPRVWSSARQACIEEGGHLAIVNSIAEAHVLMDIYNRTGLVQGTAYPNRAFLGIHDLYKEGDWVTVLDESLEKAGFTGWARNQPDNAGGGQHCGTFMPDGSMDDLGCDIKSGFFCELSPKYLF